MTFIPGLSAVASADRIRRGEIRAVIRRWLRTSPRLPGADRDFILQAARIAAIDVVHELVERGIVQGDAAAVLTYGQIELAEARLRDAR